MAVEDVGMIYLNVLIVEDKDDEVALWHSALAMHSPTGMRVVPEFAKTQQAAIERMNAQRFDAAVIDVRLKQDGPAKQANEDGLTVLDVFQKSILGVAAIFTGEASPDLEERRRTSAGTLHVFRKGEHTHSEILEWVSGHAQMIGTLREVRDGIAGRMARIFSQSVWPRWAAWTKNGIESSETLSSAMVRHFSAHLYADYSDGGEQSVHGDEWFFVPPVGKSLGTGDLIELPSSTFHVVITPRCDIASKPRFLHLLRCSLAEEAAGKYTEIHELRKKLATADPKDLQAKQALEKSALRAKDALRRFWNQGSNPSGHYLPRFSLSSNRVIGPLLVDFQAIESRPYVDAMKEYGQSRIATVAPEFLPSLVSRFASYFARFGHPNPDYA